MTAVMLKEIGVKLQLKKLLKETKEIAFLLILQSELFSTVTGLRVKTDIGSVTVDYARSSDPCFHWQLKPKTKSLRFLFFQY